MLEHPNEGRLPEGAAAESKQQNSTRIAVQTPAINVITTPCHVKVFSSLALVALLGVVLLTMSLWMTGFRLPFLPAIPDQPSISLSSGPYRIGSSITVQGTHFSRFSIVALLLDGEPAIDSSGLRLAFNTDSQGAFITTLTIPSAWSPGDHILTAKDTTSGQQVLVDISVTTPQV